MKYLLLLLAFTPLIATAKVDEVVQLIGNYVVDKDKAQSSIINLYLPTKSVATVGINGGDSFDTVEEIHDNITAKYSSNKSSLFIKNSMSDGDITTIGASTKCGVSLSIVIHHIDIKAEDKNIQPKILINSKGC